MSMAGRRIASLVSSLWLKQQLNQSRRQLLLLDTSWTALKSGKEDYLSKHIPSARFFDLNQCVEASPTMPRNLPEPVCFTDYAQSLGINRDSHLVVYDRGGMLAAARTWWTFRVFGHPQVSVLDGGLRQWETQGQDTCGGEETPPQRGTFVSKINPGLMKTMEDMVKIIQSGSCQIVDARRPEHFHGEETEPTGSTEKALLGMKQPQPESMHQGHIPGARNLLEDLLLNPDNNCLLPKDKLMSVFACAGVDLSKPMATMCYSGNAACLLALAAHICGNEDTAVYYGSWTEWGQRASKELVVKKPTGTLTAA